MVKVINVDTKTKTIHISNEDGDIKTWRTTESGTHFPIREGESTKEALDKFVAKKQGGKKQEYEEFTVQGQTYRFPKQNKHEKLWDQAWKNVQESRRYNDPAPGGYATAEHTPDETEEEVRAEYKKLKAAERAKQAKETAQKKLTTEQLERLEKKGKGWGKEQMATLRELGKVNPGELKDYLDRIDADVERHKKFARDQIDELSDNYGVTDEKDLMKKIEDTYVKAVSHYGKDSKYATDAMSDYRKAGRYLGQEPKSHDEMMQGRTLESEPDKPARTSDPRKENDDSEQKFHTMWEKYVPNEGPAETQFGELMRAAGRVKYRLWNDGDMYGHGYGKETVNNAMSYLGMMTKSKETDFEKKVNRAVYQATSAAAHYDGEEYEKQVNRIYDAFANAKWDDIQKMLDVKNNSDSLDEYPDDTSYDDDDEDEDDEW